MTYLLLSLIPGAVFFVLFILLVLLRRPEVNVTTDSMNSVHRMVTLQGLNAVAPNVLLSPRDYRMLKSRPELESVAERFWQDRRRVILSWLRLLQGDLLLLWRLRRFLVRNGVSAGFLEELRIALTAVGALLLLVSLQMGVACFGPFAFPGLLRKIGNQVEAGTHLCADLLGRVPMKGLAELEQRWSANLA